jgi:hypothetical protein
MIQTQKISHSFTFWKEDSMRALFRIFAMLFVTALVFSISSSGANPMTVNTGPPDGVLVAQNHNVQMVIANTVQTAQIGQNNGEVIKDLQQNSENNNSIASAENNAAEFKDTNGAGNNSFVYISIAATTETTGTGRQILKCPVNSICVINNANINIT